MTASIQKKIFTVEEYYKLAEVGILTSEDKVELISGEIIAMRPINSPHAGMVNVLTELLIIQLYQKASVTIQNPIRLDDLSEPEPDIVVARYCTDAYAEQHPTPEDIYIVIEVADSTLEKDRQIKTPLYAEAGVSEYWIVNLVHRQIEIHRQPKNGAYHFMQIISEESTIATDLVPLQINYSDVFKRKE